MTKKQNGLDKMFYRFNEWFDKVTDKYTEGVKRSIKGAKYIVILLGMYLRRRRILCSAQTDRLYSF